MPATPTPKRFVTLREDAKKSEARSIKQLLSSPNNKWEVLSDSPLRLGNARTGKRIGADSINCERFLPRSEWFVDAHPPTPEEMEGLGEEPAYRGSDPFGLRNANAMPPVVQIWRATDDVDLYTGKHRRWYETHGTPGPTGGEVVDRDHIFEVQFADDALADANITVGDMGQSQTNGVNAMRGYLNGVGNMNNTDWGLNRWWKGVAVRRWRMAYKKANGNAGRMVGSLGGDSSLGGVLRATLKEAKEAPWMKQSYVCCPTTQFELRVKNTPRFAVLEPSAVACDILAPVQPPIYAPNWARRVTTEMSRRGWELYNDIEHESISESLRKVLKAAGL